MVCGLALSGCGGGDESSSSASTALPSAGSSDRASAEVKAFVERWLAVERRMQVTGRTRPYLALSPDCQDCHFLAQSIARYYADGGYVRWGGWRVRSMVLTPAGDTTLVTVKANSAPLVIKASSSDPVHHLGVRRSTLYVRVTRASGSYVVTSRSGN
jgi:hypothetical protein